MKTLFKCSQPTIVIVMLLSLQCCQDDSARPFKKCVPFYESQFAWKGDVRAYGTSQATWLNGWPHSSPVFNFNADNTFTFSADFPCDSPYREYLDCDTIVTELPHYAQFRLSGTYEFSQVISQEPVTHFGYTDKLSGTFILKDITDSNGNKVNDITNGSYSINCEAERLFRNSGGPIGEFYWVLKMHRKFKVDIPISGPLVYPFSSY